MGQITATRNLAAIKVVRHTGQSWLASRDLGTTRSSYLAWVGPVLWATLNCSQWALSDTGWLATMYSQQAIAPPPLPPPPPPPPKKKKKPLPTLFLKITAFKHTAPAGTRRNNNVFTTSIPRRRRRVDVLKTLSLRHYCVMYPLGNICSGQAEMYLVWVIT